MLVGKGSLTFRTYVIEGKKPIPKLGTVLEKLEQFAFTGLGSAEEGSIAGWVAPEHLFDGHFGLEKVFRGPYAVFALRADTRKVSGPVLNAHTALEVAATLEAEGLERLSASRRREIKSEIKHRLLEETPPAQKAYGVFWNLKQRTIHIQSTSKPVNESFRTLFERTFECELTPRIPGLTAANYARENNTLDALQDARPLQINESNQLAAASA
jgi:DNA recombination-dependent growth factor C